MNVRRAGGILFPNNKTNANQPDYTGNLELSRELLEDALAQITSGGEYGKIRIAGWRKNGAKGPFMSLAASSMTPPNQRQETPRPTNHPSTPFDDDIPF